MEVDVPDQETQLVTYLKNILKYQIIPMDCMNLRDLVKEEPKNSQLFQFVEANYPGTQFMDFLRKYPEVFTISSDRSVVLAEGNNFTLPYSDAAKFSNQSVGADETDGNDRAEYVSDPDTESGDEDADLLKKDQCKKLLDMWSTSSSDSDESSVNVFSSELVHTSDSNQSSLTSSSASEN